MDEEFNPQVYEPDTEKFNEFIRKLREDDNQELDRIITRYISYKPEMAEAALYVAVERGIIAYDLREKITEQIRLNYSKKSKYAKQAVWDKNNAFKEYVSSYNDEEIYNIIDNPSEIVIDVYHAVLLAALERELISSEDFDNLFKDGIKSSRNEAELYTDRMNELYGDPFDDEPGLTDEQIEEYKSKFWKCPSCNELVDTDFEICWKCQTEKPDLIQQPDREEIIREIKPLRIFPPVKTGFTLIASGIGVFLMSFIRLYSRSIPWNHRYATLAFSAFFIILGLVFIIFRRQFKPDKR
ncbi:MAG TPA: hypothetical protein VMV47_02870 [Bacteroidales bacterium]|nr:hypothetical protein [Bacteroidales bacterium]